MSKPNVKENLIVDIFFSNNYFRNCLFSAALLESDMFSDALTASTKFEPRKRKRRISNSKDGPDVKKEVKDDNHPTSPDVSSPKEMKPALKFYRDTMEDDDEKSKDGATDQEIKSKSKNLVKTGLGSKSSDSKKLTWVDLLAAEVKTESDSEDSYKPGSSTTDGDEAKVKLYPNGVLVYKTRKGPKKSVKWKEEPDLITIKLFELDETERVNVTRNFVDMKIMERSHERESFLLARKLGM